ncbi:MAG: tyrosine-type recombinase/integrase [Marmoricola sp.]
MTGWDEHVADYLRLRRQLGFTLAWDEHLLGQFTEHLDTVGSAAITISDAIDWCGLLPEGVTIRPATRASTRLTAVRGFATYMHALDPIHEVPPRGMFARPVHRRAPRIYAHAEVTSLVEAAGHLARGVRAQTYPALFGLLAATGIRVGEALALDRDEADLTDGVLTITRGKSRDPRLVPLHETTTAALTLYAAWRDERQPKPAGDDAPFFTDQDGDRLAYMNVRHAFEQASAAAGLRDEAQPPRIHGLRHTFAVNTLLGWYRDNADVAAKMPLLSTFLGHTDPANTYWYLSAVPELLAYAANRLTDTGQRVRS